MTQVWFSGNDQWTLNTNESLMQGVYFNIFHVPFSASQSLYPGLKLYLAKMKKSPRPPTPRTRSPCRDGNRRRSSSRASRWRGATSPRANVIKEDDAAPPHGRRPRDTSQLGERRARRPRAALLPGLHPGVGR